jgi:lipopolysaccharide transport system ATP-binding protein
MNAAAPPQPRQPWAVRAQDLGKCYHIYDRPQDRLKQAIVPRMQRLLRHPPSRYYRDFWALRQVSFEIGHNETVGIVGRNGSGKSTLLQLICGTLTPTTGQVEVSGRIAALLELGSGFNPDFTGRENVYLNAALLGLSREQTEARFDAIAAFADIGPFLDQPVKTYSSGMAVRLAFAVAVHTDPDILVVDEALSVGDELFQRKCYARIEAMKEAGATILFVTHSGATVVELCDRAILLEAGELLAMDDPRRIIAAYHKLLFAPAHRRAELVDAIRADLSAADGEPARAQPGTAQMAGDEPPPQDYHDPGLVPASTVSYEPHGALLSDFELLAEDGRPVNCLVRGRRYLYRYRVHFLEAATRVRFAMLVRTVTGLGISGAYSAPTLDKALPYVAAGAEMTVCFAFDCRLNPGLYFLNAGVIGADGTGEAFLHRVVDAYAFRVLPVPGNAATELLDLCRFLAATADGEP